MIRNDGYGFAVYFKHLPVCALSPSSALSCALRMEKNNMFLRNVDS